MTAQEVDKNPIQYFVQTNSQNELNQLLLFLAFTVLSTQDADRIMKPVCLHIIFEKGEHRILKAFFVLSVQ